MTLIEELDEKCQNVIDNGESVVSDLLQWCHDNSYCQTGYAIGRWAILKWPSLMCAQKVCDNMAIFSFHQGREAEAFEFTEKAYKHALNPIDINRYAYNRQFYINAVKGRLSSYNSELVKSIQPKGGKFMAMTFTTCKRFDLFTRTMNSILECVKDLHLVDRFIVIDDNSSTEDRERMKELYPFIELVEKDEEDRGHPRSMNILLDMTEDYLYVLHSEDDFEWFTKGDHITDALRVLSENQNYGQCLFNPAYAETEKDYDIANKEFHITRDQKHAYYTHQREGDFSNVKNCAYWPGFSLRPGVWRRSAMSNRFSESSDHFERHYAVMYADAGYITAFGNRIVNIHIGKLTNETADNAYTLNGTSQFERKKAYIIECLGNVRESVCKSLNTMFNVQSVENDSVPLSYTAKLGYLFEYNDFGWRKSVIKSALSHIRIWSDLLHSDLDDDKYYAILQSHEEPIAEFGVQLNQLLQNSPKWEILYLRHPNCGVVEDEPTGKRVNVSDQVSGGYLIRKSGARKLLKWIEANSVSTSIDGIIKLCTDSIAVLYSTVPLLTISDCDKTVILDGTLEPPTNNRLLLAIQELCPKDIVNITVKSLINNVFSDTSTLVVSNSAIVSTVIQNYPDNVIVIDLPVDFSTRTFIHANNVVYIVYDGSIQEIVRNRVILWPKRMNVDVSRVPNPQIVL